MATIAEVQKLVLEISSKQVALIEDMNKINSSSKWKAAACRARKLSIELTKLYKEYRSLSIDLAKNN